MKDFEKELAGANRLVDTALRAGMWLVGCCFVICAGLYLWKFNSGLSSSSDNWSAFGSFFGGVFGPLISGVTLVALVKTIRLQQQMMLTQKKDSERVISIQNDSLKNQLEQLDIVKSQLESARLSDFKASVIRMLEQRITYYQNSQADVLTRISILKQLSISDEEFQEAVAKLSSAMPNYKDEVSRLLKFSLKLSVMEFDNVEALRAYMDSEITLMSQDPS